MFRHKTKLLAGVAALLVLAALFLLWTDRAQAPITVPQEQPQAGTVSLSIAGLYQGKQISISNGETMLQVLQILGAQDAQLQLATKEYAGLGTLVVAMHGMQNGTSGNYWQYRVNGVMPQIGAGEYQLKSGDAVEWFFGPSQE